MARSDTQPSGQLSRKNEQIETIKRKAISSKQPMMIACPRL